MLGLIGTLTLMLAIVAGLGVLNTVVLSTRERVHDLGVFKAVGMTPRQTIAMVVCWVAGTGLVAGLIAVPAGIALHRYVLPVMATPPNTGLPAASCTSTSGSELVAAGPGRAGDRGRRRAAPGGLGRPHPDRHRPARRVRARRLTTADGLAARHRTVSPELVSPELVSPRPVSPPRPGPSGWR